MDKKKAKEILDDGQTNDLQKRGTLVNNPSVVIQLFFNNNEYHTTFGSFSLTDSDMDFAVHRAKGVSIGEQDEFYYENDVEVDVYTLTDENEVKVKRFKATEDGWEKLN